MATQVQLRRGTTANHSTFTGAVGEVTVDTDKDTLVVHDGSTAGGFPLLPKTITDGTANGVLYLNGSKVATSGSALAFDGANLGLGLTPFANSVAKSFDIANGLGLFSESNNIYVTCNAYYDGGWKYKATDHATYYSSDSGKHTWHIAGSGTAGNAISWTTAMTLDASGNLLVNTGTATAKLSSVGSSGKIGLYVEGYLASNPTSFFHRDNTDGQYVQWVRHDGPLIGSGGTGYMIQFQDRNGGALGSITSSGGGAGSTAYNTSSDYRLKNSVAPMTNALAKVSLLKPVTFKWNPDNSEGQGFIAHQLQEVFPEAVTGAKDEVDDEGKPVYQGIDTSFLVATLTAAIQELKAEFDAYKATHP